MTNEDAVKVLEIIDGRDGTAQSPSFVANGHLAIRLAIEALKKESCKDAISKEAALDCLTANSLKKFDWIIDARKKIEALPSVTPISPKGHWIFTDKANEHGCCSVCDYGDVDLFDGKSHNYCPNCGADMQRAEK